MNASLSVVTAPSLRERVTARLRDAIAAGEFRPGARLIERELCEMLDVSRTSLREALRELEAEGLITSIPNRGPIVAKISVETAESIYQVRGALEALAARLFTKRASSDQIKALTKAVEGLEEAFNSPDQTLMTSRKNEFYRVLLEGAQNEVITTTLRTIRLRIAQLRGTSLMEPGRAKDSMEEYRELVNAIKARDEEAAHNISLRHVNNAARSAIAMLAREQAAQALSANDAASIYVEQDLHDRRRPLRKTARSK
jgi:GntR family transcriptional regulator, trigonelline degradation regulator